MRVMLTGHRNVNPESQKSMTKLIQDYHEQYQNDLTIISGGNLGSKHSPTGADRMWAKAAFDLGVPYELYVPANYGLHYYGGNSDMMNRWNNMCNHAAEVHVIGDIDKPFDWTNNFTRNIAMIKKSDAYAVCSGYSIPTLLSMKKGGTSHAVKSMRLRGVKWVCYVRTDGTGYEVTSLQEAE